MLSGMYAERCVVMLSDHNQRVIALSLSYVECYSVFQNAECHVELCRYAECRCAVKTSL